MKRLLILAGAAVHIKLVQTAKSMGLYTIVADNLSEDCSPAKKLADEQWMIDALDVDAIVGKVRDSGGVDGVLSCCIDPVQRVYCRICNELRLPCYGTAKQFEIMTDKRLFKQFCVSCKGIDIVPEYSVAECVNGKCYPVLVKPNESRGSRGQTVCWSPDEIADAIAYAEYISSDRHCIIEKYMQGYQDVGICYFVADGEPYLIKLADRYLGRVADKLDRQQIAALMPSHLVEDYMSECDENVKNMIRALGIKFGPVFLQAFYKDGKIYMYDPGLRFPGSDFDLAVKYATGLDFVANTIAYAIDGDSMKFFGGGLGTAFRMGGGHCLLLSFAVHAGVIGSISGIEAMRRRSGVVSVNVLRRVGDEVTGYGDVTQRVVEVCAFIPDNVSIEEFIASAYSTVSILDDRGCDMVVSSWANLRINGSMPNIRG